MLPPIVTHALEALEHGIEHYQKGGDKDRKFAFIHIDNAVELLLKEKVRLMKESIYRKNGKTIGIWEAYSILEENGIDIPHKSDLEIIHHTRNTIQHEGVTPDKSKTEVYLGEVFPFFEEFSKQELDIDVEKCLSPATMAIIRRVPETLLEDVPTTAPDLLRDAEMHIPTNPRHSIVTASTALELVTRELASRENVAAGSNHRPLAYTFKNLREKGLLDSQDVDAAKRVFDMRNKVIHTGYQPSKDEAVSALELSKKIVGSWSSFSGRKKESKDR